MMKIYTEPISDLHTGYKLSITAGRNLNKGNQFLPRLPPLKTFFVRDSFHKHSNIDINGRCYEKKVDSLFSNQIQMPKLTEIMTYILHKNLKCDGTPLLIELIVITQK